MDNQNSIRIIPADNEEHCEHVRQLMQSFFNWHLRRHTEDEQLIREYFDKLAFEKELRDLPGKYGPPDGALLLAYYGDEPAGCVGLKKLDAESCEMKRMFVYERFQGFGVGRRLAVEIVNSARELGYKKMKLDTSHRQREAQQLYESIGFAACEPFYEMPDAVRYWLVFKELIL